jgi:hypothetical protein
MRALIIICKEVIAITVSISKTYSDQHERLVKCRGKTTHWATFIEPATIGVASLLPDFIVQVHTL